MSEILFIRHAETDMAGTFCGHSDPELNARGCIQLAELIAKLRTEDIGAVFSSDSRRSRTTGIAVAEAFDINCQVRSALREINFGQWEGLTWKQIEQQDEVYAKRWVAEYPHLPAPGGENVLDFERRVFGEVNPMLTEATSKGRSIPVITHAGVLRVILCKLLYCSEEEAWNRTSSHCSVVRYPVALDETKRMQGEKL